ncbi:LOW QUALITY PROTEIN: nuclear mitotic apparatus protein 1 [Crotalus tigris]|uniref:LOW QUALITY PROTEIN: nuclear mitotic apparatus protein 1 n=1 Tax=Crotalus tigris TaxID=88082 RepID=UPI00192F42B6|nr:LOW QUALITY PROTEIN: nuclear mitotic apparatus protein 1 [Crotalus tigris]
MSSLHNTRISALLAWVNSLKLGDAVTSLSQLQDCSLFLKIIGKIHGTEEGQDVSQQSVAERVTQVVSFLQKICKHKPLPHSLVSEEKLLAAEELELAKVVTLLLYYSSMSDKIPREWTALEYGLQTEMAKFLNFMLYNEDCLGEDLENFLQKKMPPASSSSSSASSEESTPPKRGVPFLKLHKVASSSSMNKLLPPSSTSPMGEIMQTPQFQMRRLKKLLEAERENRDELEHELAENRKLIDEKDTRILMLKQRIDRLTLLQERQAAADQLEPKELEELREKNESLLLRLHETLKQCQDLKMEKGQMDRKISQLSEENGDLTFRLREFARTLTEVQEAMNEMSEGQDKSLKEWEERRSRLEADLHGALSEKSCLEEQVEILQGKMALLEDQLAKLTETLPVKGEVLGDVLKLEGLNQQVESLSSKRAELQVTVLRLEEEKRLLEASLQSERRSFEAEKAQLTGLLTELQSSSSEISRAKEKLEQDCRAQEECLIAQANSLTAEIAKLTGFLRQRDEKLLALHQQVEAERSQKGQLAEDWEKKEQRSRAAIEDLSHQVDQLSSSLKQSNQKVSQIEAASQEEYNRIAQEKELAVRQLQEKDAEVASLAERLQSLEQARTSSAVELHQEKIEASQKIQALEARVLALTAQSQQSEAQAAAIPALKSQLREAQQKLAEKEKLAKEHARLQERLMVLEESVRNTEGILEDEKRRAAESLESNLRQIAELEEQIQALTKHKDQAVEGMVEEKAKRQVLEGQMQRLEEESKWKLEELQRQLAELSSAKRELTEHSGLAQAARTGQEQSGQKFQADQKKLAALEAQLKNLSAQHQEALAALQAKLSQAVSQVKEKTSSEEKLRAKVATLEKQVAAARHESAQAKKDGHEADQELTETVKRLAEEQLKRQELEARVKQLGEQTSKNLTTAESSLSSLRATLKEKEQEAEQVSAQVRTLKAKLEEALQQQKSQLAQHREEAKRLAAQKERAQAELAAEKAQKTALEVQLQNLTNEHRVEVSGLQEEVARAQDLVGEKERELEELRLKNVSRCEELRDLQKTVSKLKGELASVEALKEREAKMENELQGFLEVARTREAEIDSLKATVRSKDTSLQSLEEQKLQWEKESASIRELYEKQLKEGEDLHGQLGKLEKQCKEQRSTITKLEKLTAASKEQQHAEAEALKREAGHQRQKVSELETLLEASKATVEKLKRELLETEEELVRSRKAVSGAQEELASLRISAQEKDRLEESRKEQMSRYRQEAERKASHISNLEQDRSILHRQLVEKEAESKDLRRLVMAESEKSKKLEERLRLLQSEMATAASRAAERCSSMKADAQNSQEQAEKLRLSADTLKKELSRLSKREEDLCQELKSWQEKTFQKEQLLAGQQQELAGAQALIGELMPVKRLYQQLQAEQASQGDQHREEVEQLQKTTGLLQAELSRTKQELSETVSLKERFLHQEHLFQQLQAESSGHAARLAALQRAHTQLAEEKRELAEKAAQGQQRLDTELAQAEQKHALELEAAKLDSEKRGAGSKREVEQAEEKLEAMAKSHEDTKRQLIAQAEKLEKQREQAKQLDELKKKLAQQEKAGQSHQQKAKAREEELRSEMKQLKEKTADLQTQLAQKEQAADHYKAQMEKAKMHYDAKKQQNQELLEKLKGLQQLEKENAELKAESERLAKELQRTALQATESELSLKSLTSQVRVLQAQLDFSDRQLREQGKVQAALENLKGRESFKQSSADISSDSLDLSTSDEGQPLNSTRKSRRSLSESGAVESSRTPQQPPHKRESLENLSFTPIPTRSRSKLESSIDSISNITLDSGRTALSGRRRTTQLINITMIKKHPKLEPLDSTNESFVSLRSSGSGDSGQESVKTRLRSAATAASSSSSIRSLASLPSQESLSRLTASLPDGTTGHAALKSLPGYRPATRSSLRHSQAGGASSGRSSFYAGSCDDEPDQLDGWNRIAELQQRNRVCPPHLKTCYPLESRPSPLLTTITDEEVMTGDPKETLRRASMLPTQIVEGPSTRRNTLSAAWAVGGVATRQQRKRLSDEPQTGPGTPELKKSSTCFPRPQTPKEKTEDRKQRVLAGDKKSKAQPADKKSERRQSLAFSILNTPKKLGNSLLRRGANRKVTPKSSPRSGSRRSPRTAASSKGKTSSRSQKVKF